jgi:hypothetical protein
VHPSLGLGAFSYFRNVLSDPEYSQKMGTQYGARLADMTMGLYSAQNDPASHMNKLLPYTSDRERVNPNVVNEFSGREVVPGTDQVGMIQRDVMSYLKDISAPYPL